MEIMKVFSDSYDEERIYSVLMDEEELYLFSELQKEFNSKSQKALRKTFDLRKGLEAAEEKMSARSGESTVGEIMDEIRGIGRRSNRKISSPLGPLGGGVHQSINNKARNLIGGNAVSGRIPDSGTARLGNSRGLKHTDKYTRRGNKEFQHFYDHSSEPAWYTTFYNKEIMKNSRNL